MPGNAIDARDITIKDSLCSQEVGVQTEHTQNKNTDIEGGAVQH